LQEALVLEASVSREYSKYSLNCNNSKTYFRKPRVPKITPLKLAARDVHSSAR